MGEYRMQDLGRESKVEGTVVVQARVGLKCLASLDHYWMENEVRIKTMSQLIGWSLELCLGMLVSQGIVGKEFKNLADAHNWMESRGLYQKSMKKRGIRKLVTAMGFEELRANGEEPENYVRGIFNQIHNANKGRNEMEIFPELGEYRPIGSDEEWERGQQMAKEDDKEVIVKIKEEGRKVLDNLKKDPRSIMEIVEDKVESEPMPVLNKLKMSESEIAAKAKEIEMKEIRQRKINQQMMTAPKGGI